MPLFRPGWTDLGWGLGWAALGWAVGLGLGRGWRVGPGCTVKRINAPSETDDLKLSSFMLLWAAD